MSKHFSILIIINYLIASYITIDILKSVDNQLFILKVQIVTIFLFSFPAAENDAFRYVTVLLSAFGLILTDIFYLAAVIHYALECQLIIFLMKATADRIRSECWPVDLAIKVN